MLRAFTERRDSSQPSPTQEKAKTWVASSSSKQTGAAKSKSNHRRKSSAKPKVMFKSQMSGPSGSQAPRTKTKAAAGTTTDIESNTTPVSKRHKAFASLLVSFLATSAVAIEPDAADEKTMQSAAKASSTPVPAAPKKAHTRSASIVKPSEIRKTRWKRFKYELGLKMKTGQKGKQKQDAAQPTEMELVDMESQQREQERKEARRVGTA